MILISISQNLVMRRYDTRRPEGLTHVGQIVPSWEMTRDDICAMLDVFRHSPPDECLVGGAI